MTNLRSTTNDNGNRGQLGTRQFFFDEEKTKPEIIEADSCPIHFPFLQQQTVSLANSQAENSFHSSHFLVSKRTNLSFGVGAAKNFPLLDERFAVFSRIKDEFHFEFSLESFSMIFLLQTFFNIFKIISPNSWHRDFPHFSFCF